MIRFVRSIALQLMLVTLAAAPGVAQPGPAPQGARGRGPAAPPVVSPEVTPDRRIAFRLAAPQAQAVRLSASDIPALGDGLLMKGPNGTWEIVTGPVPAGTYRYQFVIDGAAALDARNTATSESQNTAWSVVHVPGADGDQRNVPHGSISEVHYFSKALGADRRLHVYLPPGYERNRERYPVLYLLHGAGDSDDSWSTVGRAGFVLDNLIAAKRAKPMIVVMPAGHVRGAQGNPLSLAGDDPFVRDFVTDIVPLVDARYRVAPGRANRAIAGLSMGGSQTLNIAITQLDRFGYIGVFSSGLLGGFPIGGRGGPAPGGGAADWETRHAAALADARAKKELRLFWFATGADDFLLETTTGTIALFRKHGFNPVYQETAGGHTWLNWRAYLTEFASQLF
jgi:enterochelin esterase family protein